MALLYSQSQIADARSKIMAKINKEIDIAVRNGTLDSIFERYGISFDEEPIMPVTLRMKILVLGGLAGKKRDYQSVAKYYGIGLDNIEFIDYEEAKRLNAGRLQYSSEYSDIIYGPTPHKIEGMGDTSSLLALMESHPAEYPKVIKSISNSALKISISSFKECHVCLRLDTLKRCLKYRN